MAAGHRIGPARRQGMSEALMGRIAGRFARVESRCRARQFVLGLMSDLPRKCCWTLAEHSWIQDLARCQAAGIPGTVGFATKPQLAARMIGRALDAGVTVSWVAGDEAYGRNPHLRTAWEQRQLGYILAVAPATARSPPGRAGPAPIPWSRSFRSEPGRSCPRELQLKATAFTTGHTGRTGRSGAVATKPAPVQATTTAKRPSNHEDRMPASPLPRHSALDPRRAPTGPGRILT
ncbi:hypothetical protein GCM10010252_28480 [Streptomyces aureoverticillatus]|nr:hypothetical protein GCM10010252_28480 [Streptomyces aureoverticillatus]